MAIYMQYAKITGDVSTKGYEDWIMLSSFQFGTGRSILSTTGSGANRQGSHASVSEITITKSLDPSSLGLWADSLAGKLDSKVVFSFTLADQDNKSFLDITLTDVGVSGYSTSSGGDRPSESLSLNFATIQYQPKFYKPDGSAGDSPIKKYDLTKHVLS